KCRTPLGWEGLENQVTTSPDVLKEYDQQMIVIRQKLKAANDRQKSYADKKRIEKEFQ
ncbi:hypothetical protein KI387_005623, partial [Taxus chinensis]